MPGHRDGQVPERRVHDVEGVMVDMLPCLRRQDQEHTGRHRVLLQVPLRDQVLTLPGLADDHRRAVRGRTGLDPAGEPARHPHHVRVIQLIVAAVQPPPPPAPEPARIMAHREEGVQHHPVHVVVAAY